MHIGVVVSVVLHLALLGWALISIHTATERRVVAEPEPIAVELVPMSELTRLKQGARNAKQLDAQPKEAPPAPPAAKEAPKPTPAAAAPPPPPPPAELPKPPDDEIAKKLAALPPTPPPPPPPTAAEVPPPPPVPAPAPGPTLDEKKLHEDKLAEEQRKADELLRQQELAKQQELARQKELARLKELARQKDIAKQKQIAKAKALEKQKQADFNPNAICKTLGTCDDAPPRAEISKVAPKGGAPAAPKSDATTKQAALGAPEGRDTQLSQSELAALTQQIKGAIQPCWIVLGGGQGAESAAVRIRVKLRNDGSIEGQPQVLNSQPSPAFMAAQESAVRAVLQCQPYNLPADKYEIWRDLILNLDPKTMF